MHAILPLYAKASAAWQRQLFDASGNTWLQLSETLQLRIARVHRVTLSSSSMPASGSPGKKGCVTRVTRIHEDRDTVLVTREGEGPVAEVVDHRQTRSSVSHRNKSKKAAAIPSPGAIETSVVPRSDASESPETEDLLSEAEAILHEPMQGGKRSMTTLHNDEAGPSRLDHGGASEPADAVSDTQCQIEEVHPETVEDGTAEPHIEEPDSDAPAFPERSAPAKSGGIMPRVRGVLSSIVRMGEEGVHQIRIAFWCLLLLCLCSAPVLQPGRLTCVHVQLRALVLRLAWKKLPAKNRCSMCAAVSFVDFNWIVTC